MKKKLLAPPRMKKFLAPFIIPFIFFVVGIGIAYKYVNPAPPHHITISTGNDEGDYQTYATIYRDSLKENGIELRILPSAGTKENLQRLKDPKQDVDVAFVQDGLDAENHDTDLVSLGSLYYEPLWVFYRGSNKISRFSQLRGKTIAIGERGGATPALAWRLFKVNGIDKQNTQFLHVDYADAAKALKTGKADAGFFLATPDDALVKSLIEDKTIHLMSVDQAEAIVHQMPFLHHLVLPHGAMDLKNNLPNEDTQLLSSTATLVARDSLHPALIDLLLKAATEVHSEPGLFEAKGEFPIDKDFDYPISDEAKRFYKSGTPFWQRYLPFWVATLVDRFILALPLLALLIPLVKTVPKYLEYRVRSRIYKQYGELKYLETQMKSEKDNLKFAEHLKELDSIEDRVNHMKVPIEFSEHLYVLREHIEFVRSKLTRSDLSAQNVPQVFVK